MRNVVVGEVSALQSTICCWSATTTKRTRLPDSDVLKTMMVADTRKEIKLDEDIATIFCHRYIIGKRTKMDEWVLLRNLFSSVVFNLDFTAEKKTHGCMIVL
jgi:hypothetical protein